MLARVIRAINAMNPRPKATVGRIRCTNQGPRPRSIGTYPCGITECRKSREEAVDEPARSARGKDAEETPTVTERIMVRMDRERLGSSRCEISSSTGRPAKIVKIGRLLKCEPHKAAWSEMSWRYWDTNRGLVCGP